MSGQLALLLEQLAFGEIADESEVGGEEVVGGQRGQGRPTDFVEDAVIELAGVVADGEELQVNRTAVAIAVAQLGDARPNDGGNAEFFVEFAGERLLGGLAGFDLSAGELPLEAHWLVRPALANQNFGAAAIFCRGLAQDEGDDDQPHRLAARIAVAVQFSNRIFHSCLISPASSSAGAALTPA